MREFGSGIPPEGPEFDKAMRLMVPGLMVTVGGSPGKLKLVVMVLGTSPRKSKDAPAKNPVVSIFTVAIFPTAATVSVGKVVIPWTAA